MDVSAFLNDNDENAIYRLEYFHTPLRWQDNALPEDAPIRDVLNWSDEIKYLNSNNTDISDGIRAIPSNTGGIYVFYIKGTNLSFIENHILYIGRCKYTERQNIRKRALEYYSETKRSHIKKMFRLWKNHLYYRYFPSTDNENIVTTEAILIRAILPPMNAEIPQKITILPTQPAFP